MRYLLGFCVVLSTLAPASAQIPPTIGPSFSEKAINAANFDLTFDVKVTTVPAVPLLRNQPPEARFDAAVCNANSSGAGWVKATSKARWGVLEPGECTLFSNFSQLDLTTPGTGGGEWTAKVHLRARR